LLNAELKILPAGGKFWDDEFLGQLERIETMENHTQNKGSSMVKKIFFAALAVLMVLNLFILPHSPHFVIDKFPGFWAIFGLLFAVILARLAKGAAHTFLGKSEDFYVKKD
jgi:hypothetical protein